MKQKYGSGFRRNIRFEDADHTFVVDILIPGPSNPKGEWTTVDYDCVMADRRGRASAMNRGRGGRLSSITEGDLPSTGGPGGPVAPGQAGSGAGMGPSDLPSTGGPSSSAGQAGGGAGMGSTLDELNGRETDQQDYQTWGQHR